MGEGVMLGCRGVPMMGVGGGVDRRLAVGLTVASTTVVGLTVAVASAAVVGLTVMIARRAAVGVSLARCVAVGVALARRLAVGVALARGVAVGAVDLTVAVDTGDSVATGVLRGRVVAVHSGVGTVAVRVAPMGAAGTLVATGRLFVRVDVGAAVSRELAVAVSRDVAMTVDIVVEAGEAEVDAPLVGDAVGISVKIGVGMRAAVGVDASATSALVAVDVDASGVDVSALVALVIDVPAPVGMVVPVTVATGTTGTTVGLVVASWVSGTRRVANGVTADASVPVDDRDEVGMAGKVGDGIAVADDLGDGGSVGSMRPITMRGFGRTGETSAGSIFAIATGAATPPLVKAVELPVSWAPPLVRASGLVVGASKLAVAAVVVAGVAIAPTRGPATATVPPTSGVDAAVAASTRGCIGPADVVVDRPGPGRIPIPALSGVRGAVGERIGAGAANARLAVLARGAGA